MNTELTINIKAKVRRRALRVFDAIDKGTEPGKVRQHKLRRASATRLWYDWRGGKGGGPVFSARRDKLGRVYVTKEEGMPSTKNKYGAFRSPRNDGVKV